MFVALNNSQLTTKDKEVANSISLLFRPNKYCQNAQNTEFEYA